MKEREERNYPKHLKLQHITALITVSKKLVEKKSEDIIYSNVIQRLRLQSSAVKKHIGETFHGLLPTPSPVNI